MGGRGDPLLILFLLIAFWQAGYPGLNGDEVVFYSAAARGEHGLQQAFLLPYGGTLKQALGDLWFQFAPAEGPLPIWFLRAPSILCWTLGLWLMGSAVEKWGGKRWHFFALICASADASWLARVDLGENALSVLGFGLILKYSRVSIPALALACWSRLNFLWIAWPFFSSLWLWGSGRRFLRLSIWGAFFALGLWAWSGFSPGKYLSLPWQTPNFPVAVNLVLWTLAGRLTGVGAYLLDGWRQAEFLGAVVAIVWASVSFWMWRRGRISVRELGAVALVPSGVILAHSFFVRPLSYWHIGAFVPVMILLLSLWLTRVEKESLWLGRGLLASLFVLFLSAWPGVYSSRGDHGIATRHSTVMAELMKFCGIERCAVVDTGILNALEMGRPKPGVADLHLPALKRGAAEYLRLTEQERESWFVFLSGSRADAWHQASWVLPLWQENGYRIKEKRTLDDAAGDPVYWLVRLERASDR